MLVFGKHLLYSIRKKCLLWFGEIYVELCPPGCSALWNNCWVSLAEGPMTAGFYLLPFFSTVTHRLRFISVAPQRPQGGDLSVSRISVRDAMSGLQTCDIETPCFCTSLSLSIPTYLSHPTVWTLSIFLCSINLFSLFNVLCPFSSLSLNMGTTSRNELWAH